MKKYISLIILLTSFLLACSPIYKDSYIFHSPASNEGKYCVNNCLMIKQQCIQSCNANEQTCKIIEQAQNIAKTTACYKQQKFCAQEKNESSLGCMEYKFKNCQDELSKSSHCSSYDCENSCDLTYNHCFTNCGGEIEVIKKCTAFCN